MFSRRPFQTLIFKANSLETCSLRQWQSFSTSHRRFAEKETPPIAPLPLPTEPPKAAPSVLENVPRAYGKPVQQFEPKPLNRPIGLPTPPRGGGESTSKDKRTWKQRRDDFVDYDKHLARRKELVQKVSTPYFREWKNMKFHKGKSFIAPPRLFKAEHALYFPNFHGQTLHKDKATRDTTSVLQDKISIVSIFSNQWAENQAATFVSAKENTELHEIVKSSRGAAQFIQINVEDNVLKAWIVKMFMPGLRKKLGIENWGKYFLVRKAPSDQARDAIGFINSKVGYVYLLDGDCKIRWAGSGNSEGNEKEGLVKGVKRLVEDLRSKRLQPAPKAIEAKPVETDRAAAPAA